MTIFALPNYSNVLITSKKDILYLYSAVAELNHAWLSHSAINMCNNLYTIKITVVMQLFKTLDSGLSDHHSTNTVYVNSPTYLWTQYDSY